MTNLLFIAILLCLWVLYRFDRVREEEFWISVTADLRRKLYEMEKVNALCPGERKQFDATRRDYALCSKSLSAYISECSRLKDKINGLKSLVSRMKNERGRRSASLELLTAWKTSDKTGWSIKFRPKDAPCQCLTFDSDIPDRRNAIRSFEQITGLRVQEGGAE